MRLKDGTGKNKKVAMLGESMDRGNVSKMDMTSDDNDSISKVKNSVFVNKNRILLAGIFQILIIIAFLSITCISKWANFYYGLQLISEDDLNSSPSTASTVSLFFKHKIEQV